MFGVQKRPRTAALKIAFTWKKSKNERLGKVEMKTFFVGIKGVIIKDEKVLLIKANKQIEGRDHWEVPGGRIDDDETIEQALRRELSEEVPNIKNVKIHDVLHAHRIPRDIDGETSLVLIFYRVTADFDGEPELSEEHAECKWASLEEALAIAYPSVADAIQIAFET
jgi:8-oxo-dGTP diphosphatase